LFAEVTNLIEDFFKARKAWRDKVFSACPSNLRADLLLRSSPLSPLLLEQSGVDTILTQLRTADQDLGAAFGKKAYTEKPLPGKSNKNKKRKRSNEPGQGNKPFQKHNHCAKGRER